MEVISLLLLIIICILHPPLILVWIGYGVIVSLLNTPSSAAITLSDETMQRNEVITVVVVLLGVVFACIAWPPLLIILVVWFGAVYLFECIFGRKGY